MIDDEAEDTQQLEIRKNYLSELNGKILRKKEEISFYSSKIREIQIQIQSKENEIKEIKLKKTYIQPNINKQKISRKQQLSLNQIIQQSQSIKNEIHKITEENKFIEDSIHKMSQVITDFHDKISQSQLNSNKAIHTAISNQYTLNFSQRTYQDEVNRGKQLEDGLRDLDYRHTQQFQRNIVIC